MISVGEKPDDKQQGEILHRKYTLPCHSMWKAQVQHVFERRTALQAEVTEDTQTSLFGKR